MAKRGRKKIECSLGTKKMHSISCYTLEWQQIKIFYEKLKRERPKYYTNIEVKKKNK